MNELNIFLQENWLLFLVLTIWTTFWKGLALWIASKGEHKKMVCGSSCFKHYGHIRNNIYFLCY